MSGVSRSLRPVEGLTATSSSPPVNSILLLIRRVILVPSGTAANKPSVADPVPVDKFSLHTPAGKSAVAVEVTGYLYTALPCTTSSSELPIGVYS